MNDTCLDGSSVALNELTNGYVRVESGSIILLMGSAEPSGGTPQLLNPPPGRCLSRSISSGGPMASPRWRFCGFGSGLESNEKRLRRPCPLLSRVRQGRWGSSLLFLPGSVRHEAASSPSWTNLRTSACGRLYRMRRWPFHDVTRSVGMFCLRII